MVAAEGCALMAGDALTVKLTALDVTAEPQDPLTITRYWYPFTDVVAAVRFRLEVVAVV